MKTGRDYMLSRHTNWSEPQPVFAARSNDGRGWIRDCWLMFAQQNRLQIRLLGTFQVVVDGRPAGTGGSKRDALLALLALRRGRPASVDALIDDLWGSDMPASPRNAVQHHVARLRATLGHDAIIGTPNGYALADASTDALVFEDLLVEARVALRDGDARTAANIAARALSLWSGSALEGLADTDSVRAEAARLEELRIDALEERFEAALELGEHREIVSDLQQAVHERPFRERLWRQLMLALYRCGRAADALDAYQAARRVHVEKLGLEPGPELRRTQDAILAHDPAIAGVSATPAGAFSPPLENRRDELGRVLDQLRENLRHAEALYEWACGAAEGIVEPVPPGTAVARLAA
jgi:DNA-binding SARP family transcriptional activator